MERRSSTSTGIGSMELSATLWSRLPFKVVQRVLSFLSVTDLCRYRIVCKSWNLLISSPEFGATCAQNAAKRDASFLVICYERVFERSSSSDDEMRNDEMSNDEMSNDEMSDGERPNENRPKFKTSAGCCFLDLNTQRWHVIEDDDEKLSLNPWYEVTAMDGGLCCQYSLTRREDNPIMVYNPIGKTMESLPPSPDHTDCLPPRLHLLVDSTSQSFKVFMVNHNFDDREIQADPETTPEDLLHLLNDPLVCVYDSTTDQWEGLVNPPCVQKEVEDVCSVMFQGHLYVLVGSEGNRPLWRYNFSENTWENLAVDMPGSSMKPQFVVIDNRLFIASWLLEMVVFEFSFGRNMSRKCRFEVSEIEIGSLSYKTLFTMSNATVMEHFSVEIEILHPDFCPIIASGFGKNSLLFIAKSSRKPMVYDLKKRGWSTLPQIPLGRIDEYAEYLWAGKVMNLILPTAAFGNNSEV
ncbi:hypothetical protein KC19_1G190100 [Ceratodon purpureus]|uniref:F-box domain-containing protein n=1 Tax=Ceratodon purpureus TaxID=3225 RepID=A0A8T0J7Z4_CERPU|nr:hypothetical protein KC19_1G190100 [Ceratodon purpureus]